MAHAFLDGIGQIFFLQGMVAGILIIVGIFIAGKKFGLYALMGNFIGMIVAFFLGGEHTLINAGLLLQCHFDIHGGRGRVPGKNKAACASLCNNWRRFDGSFHCQHCDCFFAVRLAAFDNAVRPRYIDFYRCQEDDANT